MPVRVCAVADVHVTVSGALPPNTPAADILTVSGDLTMKGSLAELTRFREWLVQQPQKHKVVIAGNHDFCLENRQRLEAETILGGDNITYLRDQETTIEGLRIYGTPWQPWWHDWAFNLERGVEIALKWKLIPPKLDILLTHGPPLGFGDLTLRGDRVGCQDLLDAIKEKAPRVVCFGHIHEDTGKWTYKGTRLINCGVGYRVAREDVASREPVVYELEPRKEAV